MACAYKEERGSMCHGNTCNPQTIPCNNKAAPGTDVR